MTPPAPPPPRLLSPRSSPILVALGSGAHFTPDHGFDFASLGDDIPSDLPQRASIPLGRTASATLEHAITFALSEGYESLIVVAPLVQVDAATAAHLRGWLEAGYDHLSTTAIGLDRSPATPTQPAPRLLLPNLAARCLLAPLLSLAAGTRYTDPGLTIRAYSRRLLDDPTVAPVRGTWPNDSLFAYLAIRAPRRGYHALEIPFATDRRGAFGTSSGLLDWWRLLTYDYDPGAARRD